MKTSKKIIRHFRILSLFAFTALLFSSCLKDLSNDEPQDASALNVVNASPGPLVFNFFLNNNLVNVPSLAYGQESSYIVTLSGTKKFDAANGGTFESILADTIALENGKYYSIFVSGENNSLSTFLTEDKLDAPSSGKAKVRFINLSPDGGTLALSVKNGAVLFPGQIYKTASAFTEIDPAAYTFELKNSDSEVEHEASIDIAAGKIYTIWAGGLKDGVDNLDLRLLIRSNN